VGLPDGTRLGAYQIVSLLGAGGMGEVYRARDTKLNRDVALKILPEAFATDPDRLARFKREAQVLASLNHPNIAAIYGFEDSGSTHALVLELVEGPTLADRIAKGPIPLDEALPIAKQIAEALEAAHEQGIIHRDLKPANIKVRDDGTVKVLDFGLAKALEPASGVRPDLTNSPTITSPALMTGVGTLLGTAAYMSPEQAKGRSADKRSDVWAFGCVLYEMLTGRRAFEGEDVSDTLAAVLRADPDWIALSPDVSLAIRTLVRRCLEKDRRTRIADISTARFLMNEPALDSASVATAPAPGPPRRASWRRLVPLGVVAIVAAALTGVAMLVAGRTAPAPPVTRFVFTLPEGPQFTGTNRRLIAISPDGRQFAYASGSRLFLRSMTDFEPRAIPGTETAGLTSPVFSPDGKDVAFYSAAENALKRIAIAGGVPSTICSVQGAPLGMAWTGDSMLYVQSGRGILRVASKGGTPELLVASTTAVALLGPQLLPGNQAALFTVVTGGNLDGAQIGVQSLASGERKILAEGSDARYLTTGHLVFWRRGTLYAVAFDVGRLQLVGTPLPVVQGVGRIEGSPFANFSVSDTGSLIFIPGPANGSSSRQSVLVLVDRQGHEEALMVPSGPYITPRFSPDGKQLAVGTDDGKEANIWVYNLAGTTSIRQLTFGGKNRYPVWAANGERIAFQSDREGDPSIFWQRADGTDTADRLTTPQKGLSHIPESWSQARQRLSFSETGPDSASLWTVSVNDKKSERFGDLRSRASFNSEFSPDGRWVGYTLRDGGRATVHVRSFPLSGAHYQLRDDAHHPMWSRDGNELFYMSTTNTGGLFAMSFTLQPSPTFGIPAALAKNVTFRSSPVSPRNHDISPKGTTFITVGDASRTESGAPIAPQIRVVLNWFEELKQLVPTSSRP
jgi:hypothetical protein